MKEIDVKKWARRGPYENFKDYTDPQFSLNVKLDVTNVVKFCKKNKMSFFSTFLYIATKNFNRVEELKVRILNNKVVQFDNIDPSYVVMRKDNVITTAVTNYCENFKEFYKNCREDIKRAENDLDRIKFDSRNENNVFYVSCLTKLNFISMTNPYDIKDKEQTSIPRLTWGMYEKKGRKYYMTFSVECHHALVDGEPVSRAINFIINDIKNLKNAIN